MIDIDKLKQDFDKYANQAPPPRPPGFEDQWWLRAPGLPNLENLIPIVASLYEKSAVQCVRALRDQFPGGDLRALRDFAMWCHEQPIV